MSVANKEAYLVRLADEESLSHAVSYVDAVIQALLEVQNVTEALIDG